MAAALEDDFLRPGRAAAQGRPGRRHRARPTTTVQVRCDDGRVAAGSRTPCWPSARCPTPRASGSSTAGVEVDGGGYVPINHHCQSNVPHIYAAGDVSGKLPLSSVASMQGRKIAEHVMGLHTREHRHLDYDKAASAIFTEPEIADVGWPRPRPSPWAARSGSPRCRSRRRAKALINNDPRGFVKILSRPGHRRGARRLDRRAPRRRAHLGHRPGRHRQPQGHRHRREPAGAPVAGRSPGRRRRVGQASAAVAAEAEAAHRRRCGSRVARRVIGHWHRTPIPRSALSRGAIEPAGWRSRLSRWRLRRDHGRRRSGHCVRRPDRRAARCTSAICAEYDACPASAHAPRPQRHRRRAPSVPAWRWRRVADDLGLTVTVFGTPAEERRRRRDRSCSSGAASTGDHAAMMVHPHADRAGAACRASPIAAPATSHYTGTVGPCLGLRPNEGVNAADALHRRPGRPSGCCASTCTYERPASTASSARWRRRARTIVPRRTPSQVRHARAADSSPS